MRLQSLGLMFIVFTGIVQSQQFLNLDFEVRDPLNYLRPKGYGVFDNGGKWKVELDSTNAYKGKLCVKVYSTNNRPGNAQIGMMLPPGIVRGKRVTVGGWIRTENLNGAAKLDYNILGKKGLLAEDTTSERYLATGTSTWKYYSTEFFVDTSATIVGIMVSIWGEGLAWFDALELKVDGKVILDSPDETKRLEVFRKPTDRDIAWLKSNAISFKTPLAGNGFMDLEPVTKIVGNARIVGLGEPTHGTREVFQMKHRIVEFMATRMGFTVFAIEATMPEAYRLNEYIVDSRGDPAALIACMNFWTWRTEEFLAMVEWMRKFNQSGKGRIIFTGFDMQYPNMGVENVRRFISRVEPAWLDSLNRLYPQNCDPLLLLQAKDTVGLVKAFRARVDKQNARSVFRHLERMKETYLKNHKRDEIERVLQNAQVVLQCSTLHEVNQSSYRDSCMAVNIRWLSKRYPKEKIILWAHNGHISRSDNKMGYHLSKIFGKDYLPAAFAFHEGSYTAVTVDEKTNLNVQISHKAQVSEPGCAEWYFHQTGMPRCILDLRKAFPSDPASAWLTGVILFGEIGALKKDNRFLPTTSLKSQYDVLIFFDKTTATRLLPSPFGW